MVYTFPETVRVNQRVVEDRVRASRLTRRAGNPRRWGGPAPTSNLSEQVCRLHAAGGLLVNFE